MKINRQKFIEILIVLLLSLTPILWLHQNQVVLGHDSGFRLDPLNHLSHLFYSWSPVINFGTDWSHLKGFLVMQFPEIFFTILTHSLTYGQIITFILWFFVIGMSMYVFANNFFPERKFWILRIVSSIFYMYNFFLLQGWFIAERAKFSLFAALPLGLLIIINTLTKKLSLLRGTILFSFTFFFLNGGGSPPLYGSILLSFGLLFFFLTLLQIKKNGLSEIFFFLRILLFFTLGAFAINAYLIIPQIYFALHSYSAALSSVGGISGIIAWEAVVSKYASFINLFRLQGVSDWYQNPVHPYANTFISNPFLIIGSFIPILIILLGLLLQRKFLEKNTTNNILLHLVLLLLVFGLLFTAGSHPPLGFIYTFFLKYVPGFVLFRSAFYKFAPSVWFAVTFLFGYYLNQLIYLLKNRFARSFFGLAAILCLLLYHFPYFTGNFFNWNPPFSTKVTVPSYVYDISQYINTKTKTTDRILLYPSLDNQFHADSYSWGFWSLDLLPRIAIDRSIVADDDPSGIPSQLYSAIALQDYESFSKLIKIMGINKILLRSDVAYAKSNGIKNTPALIQDLASFPGVSLEKKIGQWSLYRILDNNVDGLITVPDSIIYTNADSSINEILSVGALTANPTIIFTNKDTGESNPLADYPSRSFSQLTCVYCEVNRFDDLINNIYMPRVKVLPDSPLYSIISFKEAQITRKYSKDKPQLMDAYMSFSSKRISELGEMLLVAKDGSEQYIQSTIDKYIAEMNGVINIAGDLSEIEKNDAYIRILANINAQNRHLSLIDNKKGLAEKNFESLIDYMAQKIQFLQQNAWMTTDPAEIRYIFNADGGVYTLSISKEEVQPQKIILDGEEISSLINIHFKKGTHRLELVYPEPQNLIDLSSMPQDKTITLGFGERFQFPIKNYQPNSIYTTSFDYKFLNGKPPFFNFVSGGLTNNPRKVAIRLETENSGRTFHYVAKSDTQDADAHIEFFANGFGARVSSISVNNLKVVKTYIPYVYNIVHDIYPSVRTAAPSIDFHKKNESTYVVQVSQAQAPYILEFNSTYNTGWKAYILNNEDINFPFMDIIREIITKSIPESQHIKTNGHGNGWIISKTGNYTILLIYKPQIVFYFGIMTSILTILLFASYFIISIKK